MFKMLKIAAASAALMLGASAHADLVVDLFSVAQAKQTVTGVGSYSSSQVGSAADDSIANPGVGTILGGYRDLSIEVKQDLLGPVSGQVASIGVTGGFLSMNTDSSVAATGIIRWDGTNSAVAIDTNGLGGISLGNVLTDSFAVTTVFSDAGFTFVIEAYTFGDATSFSTVSIVSNAHPFNNPGTTTTIPLSAFAACGYSDAVVTVACGTGGAVDFTNLGALQTVIDPTGAFLSLDLTLNQVEVVPEPGALALVGLALAGAGLATRRRKA